MVRSLLPLFCLALVVASPATAQKFVSVSTSDAPPILYPVLADPLSIMAEDQAEDMTQPSVDTASPATEPVSDQTVATDGTDADTAAEADPAGDPDAQTLAAEKGNSLSCKDGFFWDASMAVCRAL
ncbi:MAG: hypothetical protein WBA67_16550 [Jannaschia sp.]